MDYATMIAVLSMCLVRVSSRAGDGCHHVFLDAGANIGMHTRFLFEPAKYSKATYPRDVFDPWFGRDRDLATTCSFGFEPNPKHQHRHEYIQKIYAARGYRYQHFMVGLGATAGTLSFYRNNAVAHGGAHNSWGFGTTCRDNHCDDNVTVPVIDFASWIMEEIVGRAPPERPPSGVRPRVLLKMDVETAEYGVVSRMIANDTFCRALDYATIEWHPRFAPFKFESQHGATTIASEEDALTVQHALEAEIDRRSKETTCLTGFSHGDFDDESYSMAGPEARRRVS